MNTEQSAQDTGTPGGTRSDIMRLAILLFDHIEGQISLADTKTQFTLAADTLLAAALTLSGRGMAYNIFDPAAPVGSRVAAGINLLTLAALVVSIYYAALAARPTLNVPKHSRTLFYFGHIARLGEREFLDVFPAQSEVEMREGILVQVHAKSVIANHKFTRARRSISFLILALALWALLQVVVAFLP